MGQRDARLLRRLFDTESRYYRLEFVKLDLDGGRTGIAVGFRDVDAVVRNEMVAQKTLREAVAAANAANRAKSNFLSSMSHEMRTPLNAIIGLDTLLLKNPALPEEVHEQAEKIGISARHLLELINNILDMNRIDEGTLALHEEPFSLRDTIELVNAIIQNHCDEKGLAYRSSFVGKLDDFYVGDELNVKRVLINVLGNAAKYTIPPGTVSFTAEQTDILEGRHILIVEDMELNAEIVADLLEMEGMTSDWAENGRIAVEMFSEKPEHSYDAILMDLRMPVMDGLESARRIRSLDRPDAKTVHPSWP
ncbi:MAG: response regulator [Eubacteriales bacterium]|nr:response regulator [Eubacteriales bacterium]